MPPAGPLLPIPGSCVTLARRHGRHERQLAASDGEIRCGVPVAVMLRSTAVGVEVSASRIGLRLNGPGRPRHLRSQQL